MVRDTSVISPLVGSPLLATFVRLAIPGIVSSLIQMSLIVVEGWFISRIGTIALAAVATVFPLVMLAFMLSAGAVGGATSGAVARALGANDLDRACSILRVSVLISVGIGGLMGLIVTYFGPTFFYWIGARNEVLEAANAYAKVVFIGIPLIWLFNMLCSVLRGAGEMILTAIANLSVVGTYALIGLWFLPSREITSGVTDTMNIAAYILLIAYLTGIVVVLFLFRTRGQVIRFNGFRIDWCIVGSILRSGFLAGTQSTATIIYSLIATALLGRFGVEWLAGYGLAVRLELVMVPVIFGIGSALIAMVGAYAGAGQRVRAIQIAWRGTIANIVIVGAVGLILGFNSHWWCDSLSSNGSVVGSCGTTLQIIGPFYAFFAAGLGLYFASQGLDTLLWPVAGAVIRTLIVASGLLWINFEWFNAPITILWLVAGAMVFYGIFVVLALRLGAWRLS